MWDIIRLYVCRGDDGLDHFFWVAPYTVCSYDMICLDPRICAFTSPPPCLLKLQSFKTEPCHVHNDERTVEWLTRTPGSGPRRARSGTRRGPAGDRSLVSRPFP